MEGDEVKGVVTPSSRQQIQKTFGEILDEWCAFYMSIGVTYDEFWYGDYTRLRFYIRAYELKRDREFQQLNESCYLAGLYNYNAFSSVMSAFGWALGGGKGVKPKGYIEHPIAITEGEKKAEKERNVQQTIKWFMEGQGK